MPLLERKAFKRIKPPQDLDPNEILFYCKATHEVFRQYDQFFERVILCNSLIWTCSMTGKSNMTFQEAVESEENARLSLKTFSSALKKPLLYLASLTKRSRLNEMCDDVFSYVKDRFFVGEEVEAIINGVKKSCEITQVILPERQTKSPAKSEKQKPKEIAPAKIKYEVVDYNSGKTSVVKAENINRPKGAYNKPRNKLLLKHHTQMKDGVFKVKENVSSVLQLSEFQFSEVFSGPLPSYAVVEKKETVDKKDKTTARKKIVQGKLNFKKETMDERRKNLEKMALIEKQKGAAQKVKDSLKKQMEDVRLKQREQKLKEKEKKKEEKKMIAEYLNSWKKPRDDLECDDLKDLPLPTPIDCGIPLDCFGDAVMILEFLNTFSRQVQVKDVFPHGFTFDHIEKALVETDIQGVFNDLLQLFLTALFRYQESEHDAVDLKNKELADFDNLTIDQAMDVAAVTSTWPQKFHGTVLRNLPLDSFSITEVLRLHLLSSGARSRVSWQGVVTPSEDPGLYFKIEEAELLKKLGKISVFEFDCVDRCKILSVLMHQLLASDVFRFAVDECADNTKPLRNQLRELRLNYARKLREDSNVKKKEPKEKDETNKEGPSENATPPVDEEEKENSKDLTPEEKAALEEKKSKEAARLKAEFQRKEREIESQIRKLQLSFNLTPIGRDRAFRRYWIFQNIAGVFVEDDDPYKGVCLPKPVPQLHNVAAAAVKAESSPANIKKYLVQNDSKNGSSDKENEILRDIAIVQSELPFPSKNRKLSDLNPRVDFKKSAVENSISEPETCQLCVNKSDVQGSFMKYCPHSKANLASDQCSANIDTCPVHNVNAPRTKWAFYYKEEELDALINSLNSRGFRERALKDALVSEKERIQELLSKCPSNSFNKSIPQQTEQLRKSQRHQSSLNSSYAGMAPDTALELTLRDMILELEHRIFAGGLGSLKVPDREVWRATIEQQANRNLNGSDEKDDIESDIKKLSLPVPPEKVIKDLATALLELSQGIEAKYLNPPLGESDEQKKAKQKQQDDETQQKKKKTAALLESWQESLLQSTSISQLFVHLGTLERSVAWSRSVLKAHCRICRRRGDAENMLLCDGCNRGHHLYCLKPPLKAIPEGDWFCLSCKPVEVPVTPTKKSRKEESEEEEEESDEDEEEEDEEDEESDDDDVDVEGAESDESEEETTFVQEACEACGDVGTLLCCDGCPLMYHAECVNLKRIPRGEWLCPKCSKKEEASKKAQKNPSNGTYGTRSSKYTEKKKSNPSLKTKIAPRAAKRKYEDSFEEEFEPPSKKARETKRLKEDTLHQTLLYRQRNTTDEITCLIGDLIEYLRTEKSKKRHLCLFFTNLESLLKVVLEYLKGKELIPSKRKLPCNLKDPMVISSILELTELKSVEPFWFAAPELMKQTKKIGEGTFGEVFEIKLANSERRILKIQKIENIYIGKEAEDNAIALKDIISELNIMKSVSNICNKKLCESFLPLHRISIIHDKFPAACCTAWKDFNIRRKSKHISPEMYSENQMFLMIETTFGGVELQKLKFQHFTKASSIFIQCALALAIAEEELEMEHRDLHLGNILISMCSEERTVFVFKNNNLEIKLHGVKVKLIDFTYSRIKTDKVHFMDLTRVLDDKKVRQRDFNNQRNIYRMMKLMADNDWESYQPRTNVLWLKFIVGKLIRKVKRKVGRPTSEDVRAEKSMKLYASRILDYTSASHFVKDHVFHFIKH